MIRSDAQTPLVLVLLGVALVGCTHDKGDDPVDWDSSIGRDEDSGDDTSTTEDTGDIDTGVIPGVHGTVEGTVYLQLYTIDQNGDMQLMDWEETYGGYPFGPVFVAAYSSDEDGHDTYYDQNVISAPTVSPAPGGDPYGLDIDVDDIDSVQVYASVDYANDGVLSTAETTGAYPSAVTISSDGTVTGIDITVMVPWAGDGGGGGGTGWGYGNGSGGSGCDETIEMSGTVTISSTYLEGDVAALIYDTAGAGPYAVDRETPTATSGGAEAPFSFSGCSNVGDYNLLGAWDSNANGLFDPADKWGAYVTDGAVDGNPITIGDTSMTDLEILVPFGDYQPSVVPFVSISGTLTSSQDWSAYSDVYVAALKYRPNSDVSVADLKEGYDIEQWSTSELAANSAFDFHVEVPANTIVYVWAYADVDGDGILNEVGDPIASLNDSTGRTVTGSTSQGGADLNLDVL